MSETHLSLLGTHTENLTTLSSQCLCLWNPLWKRLKSQIHTSPLDSYSFVSFRVTTSHTSTNAKIHTVFLNALQRAWECCLQLALCKRSVTAAFELFYRGLLNREGPCSPREFTHPSEQFTPQGGFVSIRCPPSDSSQGQKSFYLTSCLVFFFQLNCNMHTKCGSYWWEFPREDALPF